MVLFVLIAELSLKDTEELTHPVRDAVPVQMTTQEREMGEKNAHTKLLKKKQTKKKTSERVVLR